ncbi:MAG: glycosyltransferase family 2 protein [Acidobacteria bacterium]|nr:glycosyltransferase family 2 protein [Acidobacteriota bacterium]
MSAPQLSVIIPVYNEEANLPRLHPRLLEALQALGRSFEILYIDDGSTDGSFRALTALAEGNSGVKVIRFARNFGQTAAMAAGFEHARGEVIVPLDADLQNDPEDMGKILKKLEEGYDVVSCWRKERKDPWLTRRLPSAVANKLISWISGVHLHDYGCTLKGYRREVTQHIRLYGEMHRFIPIFAFWAGARVAEIVVRHHPRQVGRSKYGLSRTLKVLLDLVTVKFLTSFSTKPMYFFGGAGSLLCAGGILFGVITLVEKYTAGTKAHRNPLLLLAATLFLIGVQFVLMGVVAELVIRTYHESQNKPTYIIHTIINGAAAPRRRIGGLYGEKSE